MQILPRVLFFLADLSPIPPVLGRWFFISSDAPFPQSPVTGRAFCCFSSETAATLEGDRAPSLWESSSSRCPAARTACVRPAFPRATRARQSLYGVNTRAGGRPAKLKPRWSPLPRKRKFVLSGSGGASCPNFLTGEDCPFFVGAVRRFRSFRYLTGQGSPPALLFFVTALVEVTKDAVLTLLINITAKCPSEWLPG